MFYGEYQHNVDEKGRIIIPAKFREQLGEIFYVTIDLWGQSEETCLYVYPEADFKALCEKLRTMGSTDQDTRKLLRRFYSRVQDTSTDKQGRIVLMQELRDHAGLEKEIVLVGQDNHIEIWDRDKWTAYNNDDSFYNSGKLAEGLRAGGV
ncbi:MAG: division/cell wall cluster transcriptional repressor MraZ [Lachnospiraceae bacterium]|nr:division/cell wall cluster transcriptional repressor MraZ [Lachnospiraceae bacterium]